MTVYRESVMNQFSIGGIGYSGIDPDKYLRLVRLHNELEHIEQHVHWLAELGSNLLTELLDGCENQREIDQLAFNTYWGLRYFDTAALATFWDISEHDVHTKIRPYYPRLVCHQCHKKYAVELRTRQQLYDLEQTYPHLCHQCRGIDGEFVSFFPGDNIFYLANEHPDVNTLREMPYKDYLQTNHWKEIRKRARWAASNRCQVCNTNERTLHVHHRTYENRGNERPEDVIVLCDECHATFHENGKLAQS